MAIANPNSPVTNAVFQKTLKLALKQQTKNLIDAIEAVTFAMDTEHAKMRKESQQEHAKTRKQISEVKQELRSTKSHLRDAINGLKMDIATTPTRSEFEVVKKRVQKLENRIISQ